MSCSTHYTQNTAYYPLTIFDCAGRCFDSGGGVISDSVDKVRVCDACARVLQCEYVEAVGEVPEAAPGSIRLSATGSPADVRDELLLAIVGKVRGLLSSSFRGLMHMHMAGGRTGRTGEPEAEWPTHTGTPTRGDDDRDGTVALLQAGLASTKTN